MPRRGVAASDNVIGDRGCGMEIEALVVRWLGFSFVTAGDLRLRTAASAERSPGEGGAPANYGDLPGIPPDDPRP